MSLTFSRSSCAIPMGYILITAYSEGPKNLESVFVIEFHF